MDNAMISKIEKARRYATQPERVTFDSFSLSFQGDNASYTISLSPEGWNCTCDGFAHYGLCPHIMTLERVLEPMLKRHPTAYANGQNVVSDVQKTLRYKTEPDRVAFTSFEVSFQGDNNTHTTRHRDGQWHCTCGFFASHSVCCHSMALERILGVMLPVQRQQMVG